MNINELTIKKDLQNVSGPSSIADIFHNAGWHFMGDGQEASVAMHPKLTYVLKIFNRNSNYTKFVNFCERHAGNPHVPKFNRYVKEIPGTNFNYVRMERLDQVWDDEFPQFYPELCVLVHYALTYKVNFDMQLLSGLEPHLERYFKDPRELETEKGLKSILEICFSRDPSNSWFQIAEALVKDAQQLGLKMLDIHGNNVMTRGNVLVITDPYYK